MQSGADMLLYRLILVKSGANLIENQNLRLCSGYRICRPDEEILKYSGVHLQIAVYSS